MSLIVLTTKSLESAGRTSRICIKYTETPPHAKQTCTSERARERERVGTCGRHREVDRLHLKEKNLDIHSV